MVQSANQLVSEDQYAVDISSDAPIIGRIVKGSVILRFANKEVVME
jgi:hypothetical protein